VIQMLKQITSRKLRPAAGLPADDAGSVGQLKRFWQVRYHDFPVWTEAKRIPPVSLRSRVGMTIARRSCSPWIGRAARGLEVEQLRALRHGRWWILNRNEPHGSENGWEWCRRYRRPTLPHKPREGWGNLWWRIASDATQLERFWQVRYYDFPVWTEAKRIPPVSLRSRVGMTSVRRSAVDWPRGPRTGSGAASRPTPRAVVDIESQWTARKRERLGVVSAFSKAHPPAETAGRVGQPLVEK